MKEMRGVHDVTEAVLKVECVKKQSKLLMTIITCHFYLITQRFIWIYQRR